MKEPSRLLRWSRTIESGIDMVLDRYSGCLIASLVVSTVLIVVLAVGWATYDAYLHRGQHCIHATREWVTVGHLLTQKDVCDTWQNN